MRGEPRRHCPRRADGFCASRSRTPLRREPPRPTRRSPIGPPGRTVLIIRAPLDRAGIEALIPHREPFLLIDRVTLLEPGVRAVAEHEFTGEEWYLKGHFPGNPIVPGVILTESMAQTATVMAMALPDYRNGLGLFAGIDEMRFKRIVRPGETGRFEATMEKMRRGYARVIVRAFVGDELAAEGTIQAVFQPKQKTT